MDILDDIDDEPDITSKLSNFGGPGDYMMMDDDDIDSSTPELPRRTEDSKHLLNEQTGGDAVYSEPAPVWSPPSSEWIICYILSHIIHPFLFTEPPKIDDNVSNSPPSHRKVIAGII